MGLCHCVTMSTSTLTSLQCWASQKEFQKVCIQRVSAVFGPFSDGESLCAAGALSNQHCSAPSCATSSPQKRESRKTTASKYKRSNKRLEEVTKTSQQGGRRSEMAETLSKTPPYRVIRATLMVFASASTRSAKIAPAMSPTPTTQRSS